MTTVLAAYDALVAAGELRPDPEQRAAAARGRGRQRGATVGEAWDRRLEIDPENVPGQGEVVRLLSALHRAGLVRSDVEGDVGGPPAMWRARQVVRSVPQTRSSALRRSAGEIGLMRMWCGESLAIRSIDLGSLDPVT